MKCLRCELEHDGSYGSGKYCSKKCAFTKNETQLLALRKPKTEETKKNMRKPKSDTSRMGKYDKSGKNNPNSIQKNGKLVDRDGDQYINVKKSNIINGQRWSDDIRNAHSEIMYGDSNWMRNKKHTDETKFKISLAKIEQYKKGEVNINEYCISKGEKEIISFLKESGIKYIPQYTIEGYTFKYDIYLPFYNLIIEYNGDYWHANPEIYDKDKIIKSKSAIDIWNKDSLKKEIAIKNGYKFYTIWEKDYNINYKNVYNNNLIKEIFKNEGFDIGS